MGKRLMTWDERKAAKMAYLENILRERAQQIGQVARGQRHTLEYKRFIAEMIDVYCSHSLPVYASFQAATGLTYATLKRWRKTVHVHHGQHVPDEVRWALDNLFNYTEEDTDE